MNKNQLQQYLENEKKAGSRYVALQDCNFEKKPLVSNCIRRFHPNTAQSGLKGFRPNIDIALAELADYVEENPKYYKLHVRRTQTEPDWKTVDLHVSSDELTMDEQPTIIEKPMNEPVRSFEEALKDKARIAELESKVREQQREIADLEMTVEDLERELNDAQTTAMADNTTSTLGQVATLLPGIIDRFFEMQERKINAMQNQPKRPPMPKPTPNGYHEGEPNSTVYEDYGL